MLKIDALKIVGLPPLTFEVPAGECLAIEGPSGSGKTRLLRGIADLDPAAGHVFHNGLERGEVTGPAWRRIVRYCSAEPGWWEPTVRRHLTAGTSHARFLRLILQLDLAERLLDRPLSDLSSGERQRMALALALADEPAVLLLDEPTGALDAGRAGLVEELIKFQMLSGRIVLLVSHDEAQIGRLAHSRLQLASFEPRADLRDAGAGFA